MCVQINLPTICTTFVLHCNVATDQLHVNVSVQKSGYCYSFSLLSYFSDVGRSGEWVFKGAGGCLRGWGRS